MLVESIYGIHIVKRVSLQLHYIRGGMHLILRVLTFKGVLTFEILRYVNIIIIQNHDHYGPLFFSTMALPSYNQVNHEVFACHHNIFTSLVCFPYRYCTRGVTATSW